MAAELVSTSLPHTNEVEEVEVKKSFILQSEPDPTSDHDRDAYQTNDVTEERDSWPAAPPTLRERNALMFNNEQMADAHFLVGPPGETQKVPAHKVQNLVQIKLTFLKQEEEQCET